MTYTEKLRDPRWQKKRLEVLQRDEFACTECKRKDLELQVHHRYYEKGFEPWEYDFGSLTTLCVECHGKRSDLNFKIGKVLGLASLTGLFHFSNLLQEQVDHPYSETAEKNVNNLLRWIRWSALLTKDYTKDPDRLEKEANLLQERCESVHFLYSGPRKEHPGSTATPPEPKA